MPIADTIRGFKEIVDGKHDELPEQAFYLVGTIDEAVAKCQPDRRRKRVGRSDSGTADQAPRCRSSRPIASLVNETVDEVEIPGTDGYFGVLPGHTPLLAALQRRRAVVPRRARRSTTCRSRSASPRCSPTASRSSRRSPSRPTRSTSPAPKRRRSAPRSGIARPAIDMDSERARIALLKSLIRLQVAELALEFVRNCFPTSPTCFATAA